MKPTRVIIEEAASERLLTASAVMEIAPVTIPVVSFAINKIMLQIIPTIPAKTPYERLTIVLLTFSLSFIKSRTNKFVIVIRTLCKLDNFLIISYYTHEVNLLMYIVVKYWNIVSCLLKMAGQKIFTAVCMTMTPNCV